MAEDAQNLWDLQSCSGDPAQGPAGREASEVRHERREGEHAPPAAFRPLFSAPVIGSPCRVVLDGVAALAMAERYATGLGKNQKRKVRRTLADRLHLALRDAQGGRSGQPEEVKSESEEPPTRRAKPSRARHLLVCKGEPEDVKSESEDVKSEPDEVHEVHSESEDLEEESRLPGTGGGGASGWIEAGRRRKQKEGSAGSGSRVRLVPATACKSAARRGAQGSAAGGSSEPPWRERTGEAPLAGGRDVLPRWRVENEMLEAERGGPADEEPDRQLISKVGTQLLRWGRSDIACAGGRVRCLTLPGWLPDAWTDVQHLANTLQVRPELLEEVLQSSHGTRGPRILFEQNAGRGCLRVKARWTKTKGKGKGKDKGE